MSEVREKTPAEQALYNAWIEARRRHNAANKDVIKLTGDLKRATEKQAESSREVEQTHRALVEFIDQQN